MAEAKNIALCLEYPIGQFGGTEILVRELIQGLAAGWRITLVSPDDPASLESSGLRKHLSGHLRWIPAELSVAKSEQLARDLAGQGIQLAHFHFGGNYSWGNRYFKKSPILFVSRRGIPCLSTNHGAFSIMDGYCGPQRRFLRWALFLPAWFNKLHVLSYLRTEIAVSGHDYRALCRWYWPLRSKFGQIYHSRLVGPPPPPRPDRQKTIICVGTIGLRKGQTFLTAAFARIGRQFPDWKLVLIGRPAETSMVREIQSVISQNHLAKQVVLIDKCTNEELDEWLKSSAIFAMPSLFEGLGLSLQEALFNGCACIASAAGGITDLVQHGVNGLLVAPRNVDQLANGLNQLMTDAALRQRFSVTGPQSILDKGMLAEIMVAKYDRLYCEILNAEKPAMRP